MVKSKLKISSHLTSRHPLDNGWQPVRYMEEALDCSGCLGRSRIHFSSPFTLKLATLSRFETKAGILVAPSKRSPRLPLRYHDGGGDDDEDVDGGGCGVGV